MTDSSAQKLRIVFVSAHDPLNVRAFSGTVFYMAQALRERFPEIELVRFSRPNWYERLARLVIRATAGRVNPNYWHRFNALFVRRLARRWRGQRVLVIGVVSAALVSELARWLPVINVTDATFRLMRDFYPDFARYGERTARAAEDIERRSILLSAHNSFSSKWAADSAINHYGALASRVSADSWGSNLPHVAREAARLSPASRDNCRLLFLGVDWVRKGGDVVCEAGEILAERGFPVRIDLVGSAPSGELLARPWLHDHGFLSKAKEEEAAQLQALIRDADFLFLPTRQDTYGMVFGEANAFGTPALTRSVGGVADVVRHQINGLVLPQKAQPVDFAEAVETLWKHPEEYQRLRESSRREYEERLNWRCWAQRIELIIANLEAQGRV